MQTHTELWTATLADLELQLAAATYDTWLRSTQASSVKGNVLSVQASSQYAADWLNEELNAVVARTASHMAGRRISVVFIVNNAKAAPKAQPQQPDLSFKFYDFDILSRGWVTTPSYVIKFWMPLVGVEAFGAYLLLKAIYYNTEGKWTRTRTVYLQLLADTCGCHRQTLIGRNGKKGKLWRLQEEGIAHIQVTGNTKTRRYIIRVLNNLPMLTPTQLAKLPLLVQKEHATFLVMAKLEKEEWEQLSLMQRNPE